MQPEYSFAEIVTGGARNRGNVCRVPDILSLDYYGKPTVTDAYSSIYLHTDQYRDFKDEDGGKRGYTGLVKADFLNFDFDGMEDTALIDVRDFVQKVCVDKYSVFIDDFRFYFSGNKGFHIYILSKDVSAMLPGIDVPDKIKRICMHLASRFSTFDRSVYDRTRIFRIPNSRHGKSGLFKIPLYGAELWYPLDYIREIAKKQRCLKDPETIRAFLKRNVKL